MKCNQGFTLIELIAVILIIGVISVSITTRMMPSALLQLQSARDIVISSLFLAQQKAMSQQDGVQVITSGSNLNLTINGSSTSMAGIQYPYTLPHGVTISNATLNYDGLGHTSANSITLTKGSKTVTVTVTGTGYAY